MFQSRERTIYNVKCDGCGMPGPDALTKRAAGKKAEQDGWEIVQFHNSLNYITRHYCPTCAEIQEEKDNKGGSDGGI